MDGKGEAGNTAKGNGKGKKGTSGGKGKGKQQAMSGKGKGKDGAVTLVLAPWQLAALGLSGSARGAPTDGGGAGGNQGRKGQGDADQTVVYRGGTKQWTCSNHGCQAFNNWSKVACRVCGSAPDKAGGQQTKGKGGKKGGGKGGKGGKEGGKGGKGTQAAGKGSGAEAQRKPEDGPSWVEVARRALAAELAKNKGKGRGKGNADVAGGDGYGDEGRDADVEMAPAAQAKDKAKENEPSAAGQGGRTAKDEMAEQVLGQISRALHLTGEQIQQAKRAMDEQQEVKPAEVVEEEAEEAVEAEPEADAGDKARWVSPTWTLQKSRKKRVRLLKKREGLAAEQKQLELLAQEVHERMLALEKQLDDVEDQILHEENVHKDAAKAILESDEEEDNGQGGARYQPQVKPNESLPQLLKKIMGLVQPTACPEASTLYKAVDAFRWKAGMEKPHEETRKEQEQAPKEKAHDPAELLLQLRGAIETAKLKGDESWNGLEAALQSTTGQGEGQASREAPGGAGEEPEAKRLRENMA